MCPDLRGSQEREDGMLISDMTPEIQISAWTDLDFNTQRVHPCSLSWGMEHTPTWLDLGVYRNPHTVESL